MTDLISALTKYWVVLSGLGGIVFSIGYLYAKVQLNINGTTRLFSRMEENTIIIAKMQTETNSMKEQIHSLEMRYSEHHRIAAERYGSLNTRMDDVMKILIERK